MHHREEFTAANGTKERYVRSLGDLIERRTAIAAEARSSYIKDVFVEPERYRADLCRMLGWPLVDCERVGLPDVNMTPVAEEETHRIYRATFTVLDGVELSGLYYEYKEDGKHPLVLVQHGALGTPELISGFYGTTSNYNDMLERVTCEGVHVFAPQLLLWEEKYGVPFDRATADAALKRVGSSIAAVELYALQRVLDYFEAQPDVGALGMVGMSYGGFFTLHLAAIDTRIRSAVSCAYFNTLDKVYFPDWAWQNAAYQFSVAEVAALVYPRHLCLEIAESDPLLSCPLGKRSYERLCELSQGVGTDWVELIPFVGVHEFCKDDTPIRDLVHRLKDI